MVPGVHVVDGDALPGDDGEQLLLRLGFDAVGEHTEGNLEAEGREADVLVLLCLLAYLNEKVVGKVAALVGIGLLGAGNLQAEGLRVEDAVDDASPVADVGLFVGLDG